MNDRDPAQPLDTLARPAASLPFKGLAFVCTLHALPLGWAAWMLPFRAASWLTVALGLLALLHASVALLSLLRREPALRRAWLALSLYSLLLLLGTTIVVASAALYLSGLYQDIGQAVSAALAGIWGLLVLLTVPVSVWGLAYTWPRGWLRRGQKLGSVAAVSLLALAGGWLLRGAARAREPRGAASSELLQSLTQVAQAATQPGTGPTSGSLLHSGAATCTQIVSAERLTLLVTALAANGQPLTACLQADDAPALTAELTRLLGERQRPGTPLKLDLVRGVQPIRRLHPLLDALSLRPALDGVCSEHACFAPWQLIPFGAFTRYHPLPAVPDAAFGASLDELAGMLGARAPATAPLFRIETDSLLVQGGQAVPYLRTRPAQVAADLPAISRAVALAGAHIMAAQRPDGGFRYLLDPFTGQAQDRLNLPRQAGTTLALCELIPGAFSQAVAGRALSQLRSFEQRSGALSAISDNPTEAELGPSALPLIAFASCRPQVGDQHDELIGRLAKLLLTLQRADGSFYPLLQLPQGTPTGDFEPLYAGGQAVFALVLVEQLASAHPSAWFPQPVVLKDAVERAMSYYARSYWPRALRSLFYIEENWHCLAARAALSSHRHEDYEQFCLDYVAFKARLILEPAGGVTHEHVGGYGLSDMFPPHSTATAGFGEALAASLAVEQARGQDLHERQNLMRRVLSFVLRQQWTYENCFACAQGREAIGGFSESEASASIRIDYVQHAMAALGHGQRALALKSAAH